MELGACSCILGSDPTLPTHFLYVWCNIFEVGVIFVGFNRRNDSGLGYKPIYVE